MERVHPHDSPALTLTLPALWAACMPARLSYFFTMDLQVSFRKANRSAFFTPMGMV